MKVHNKKLLTEFSSAHVDAKSQIDALVSELEIATWSTPHELKQRYPKASIIGNNNVVFNIRSNRYRLWVIVSYQNQIIMAKKIGTHKEYDKWEII